MEKEEREGDESGVWKETGDAGNLGGHAVLFRSKQGCSGDEGPGKSEDEVGG